MWYHAATDSEKSSPLQVPLFIKIVLFLKVILFHRCDYFRRMFQTHWDENAQDTIEINGYSFPVVYSFLKWLYTDHVELPPEDAIGKSLIIIFAF